MLVSVTVPVMVAKVDCAPRFVAPSRTLKAIWAANAPHRMTFPPRNSGCATPHHIRSTGLQLTVTDLGAAGRKLMLQDISSKPNPNVKGEFDLMRNDAYASHRLASPVPPSSVARSPDVGPGRIRLTRLPTISRPECATWRFAF